MAATTRARTKRARTNLAGSLWTCQTSRHALAGRRAVSEWPLWHKGKEKIKEKEAFSTSASASPSLSYLYFARLRELPLPEAAAAAAMLQSPRRRLFGRSSSNENGAASEPLAD